MNTDPIWAHSQADPNGKLVLLAIAHRANHHGEASLHVRDLMQMTGLTRRGVQRIIRRLEEIYEIFVVHAESGNAPSLYVISVTTRQKQGRANETPAPAGRRDFPAPPVPVESPKTLHVLHAEQRGANGRNGAA